MALSQRMRDLGLVTPDEARRSSPKEFRRFMLATEGGANTGKTEFALSAPGPGALVACDRGFDGLLDNPKPPPTRMKDFGVKVVKLLTNQMSKAGQPKTNEAILDYAKSYTTFREAVYGFTNEPSIRTVIIDGDNVSWETQRLAYHGTLTGVYPTTKFTDVKAARRAFYNRLWDSGKIIIGTNMIQEEWIDEVDPQGNPVLDDMGQVKRKPAGTFRAQGYPDQEYVWQLRVRHLYKPAYFNAALKKKIPQQWGLSIIRCKSRRELEGQEIWGADCCFAGLMEYVYPHIPPKEWGL